MVVAPPTMEQSPESVPKQDQPSSSSSSSSVEVSVKFDKEVAGSNSGAVVDNSGDDAIAGGGAISNGGTVYSGFDGTSLPRLRKLQSEISTFPIASSDKLESPSAQLMLKKSKTERPRRSNTFVEDASQIFDEKISVHQKEN